MGIVLRQTDLTIVGRMTVEEYFAFEEKSQDRHMFLDGLVVRMQGGTYEQSAIMSNVNAELRVLLRGTPCRPLESNMNVKYGRLSRYGYTDGLVVCGPPQFEPHPQSKKLCLLNPTVVVEVMSESSREFDRREKFQLYSEIETFREYLLIDQTEPYVEVFARQGDGAWQVRFARGLDDAVTLKSIGGEGGGVVLSMRAIYDDITFPPPITDADVPTP